MRSEQLSIVPGFSPSPTKLLSKSSPRTPKGKLAPDAIQEIISTARVKTQSKVKKTKLEKHQGSEEVGPEILDGTPISQNVSKRLSEKGEGGRAVLSPIDISAQVTTSPVSAPAKRTRIKSSATSISNGKPSKKPVALAEKANESVSVILGRRSNRLRGDVAEDYPAKKVKIVVDESVDEVSTIVLRCTDHSFPRSSGTNHNKRNTRPRIPPKTAKPSRTRTQNSITKTRNSSFRTDVQNQAYQASC